MPGLYKPLAEDEIRILFLHSASDSSLPESIECTLKTVLLSNYKDRNVLYLYHTAYDALSYVWGTEPATSTIQVNGDPFAIHPNLVSALRCFQDNRFTRALWVDALCIDQDDLKERTQQVALMPKIYGFANEVLIWLGPLDADIVFLFKFIDAWTSSTSRQRLNDIAQLERAIHMTKEKILSNPWFTRIWVVQEFAVANAVVFCCGKARLRPDKFMRFLQEQNAPYTSHTYNRPFDSQPWIAEMGLLVSYSVENTWQDAQSKDLHGLLAMLRSREASDPRDKAFALAGLADRHVLHGLPDFLAARYDRSVLQAYTATVCYCLEAERSASILCSAGLKMDDPSWPSWVPDWSVVAPPNTRLKGTKRYKTLCDDEYVFRSREIRRKTLRLFPRGSSFRVPSREKASAVNANGNTLSIRGVLVGSLESLWDQASTPSLSGALGTHFERVALMPGPYWETFGQGGCNQAQRQNRARELTEDVLDDFACTAMPRTLGFLENGMPVYGPSNMRTGDFVAMMLGCVVPLVFRDFSPHGGISWPRKCRLVGECYVHGLMDYEQADERGEIEWLDEVADWFEVT